MRKEHDLVSRCRRLRNTQKIASLFTTGVWVLTVPPPLVFLELAEATLFPCQAN